MNEVSSRSHLVLTITINTYDERDMSITSSKLNIVDLAGSERTKDSNVSGKRMQEACYINKSLFTLGAVIDTVIKNFSRKAKSVVPFRNSKLTQILSDSIGGNCKTTLLAMLSPS